LEHGRRAAAHVLTKGCSASGLLEEFTRMEVSLGSLLSGEVRPQSQAMFVAIVEAEGRLVERCIALKGDKLDKVHWAVRRSKVRRIMKSITVDLKDTSVTSIKAAGADALKLATPLQGFVFIAKDISHHRIVERCLQGTPLPVDDEATSKKQQGWSFAYPGASLARSVGACMPVPMAGASIVRSVGAVAARLPDASWINGKPPQWKDLLRRWPANRIVINDAEPFLETPPTDPLTFSANLLRSAVDAQGKSEKIAQELTLRSGALKCVTLGSMTQQDLWCFWVNVFHCLLLHAQLVAGRPKKLAEHDILFQQFLLRGCWPCFFARGD
jgi:hypothetical protein